MASKDEQITKHLRSPKSENHDPIIGKLQTSLEFRIGCKLPTNHDILSYFLYLNSNSMANCSKDQVAKVVIDKLEIIWKNSGIPYTEYKSERSKKMLQKLYLSYDKLRKNVNKPFFAAQKEAFIPQLEELFDIAKLNAEDLIRQDKLQTKKDIQDDIKFLSDQRSERKQSLGAIDENYARKELKRVTKVIRHEQSATKEQEHCAKLFSCDKDDPSSINEPESDDLDFVPKVEVQPQILKLPTNPLSSPTISKTADRLGMSVRDRTMFMASVIKAGGGSVTDFKVSKTSSHRASQSVRLKEHNKIVEEFRAPKFSVLHWDGKIIPNEVGVQNNRLAILISGSPDHIEGKLLGVPIVEDGTGECEASSIESLIDRWGVRTNVKALCFDTTASNSGQWKGACILLERKLDKKLLMLGCRHHILELILGAAYKKTFGDTKSPINEGFKQFREKWSTINIESGFKTLTRAEALA